MYEQTDFGQVLLAVLVETLKWLGPRYWQAVAILDWTQKEQISILRLAENTSLAVCLLFDGQHQAFSIVQRGTESTPGQLLVFDGLRKNSIWSAAKSSGLDIAGEWGLGSFEMNWAKIRKQDGPWECGHRIVAGWRALLPQLFPGGVIAEPLPKINSLRIPEEAFSEEQLLQATKLRWQDILDCKQKYASDPNSSRASSSATSRLLCAMVGPPAAPSADIPDIPLQGSTSAPSVNVALQASSSAAAPSASPSPQDSTTSALSANIVSQASSSAALSANAPQQDPTSAPSANVGPQASGSAALSANSGAQDAATSRVRALGVGCRVKAEAVKEEEGENKEQEEKKLPQQASYLKSQLRLAALRGKVVCEQEKITNHDWQTKHRVALGFVKKDHWNVFKTHKGGCPTDEVSNCKVCAEWLQDDEGAIFANSLPPQRRTDLPNCTHRSKGHPKRGEDRRMDVEKWLHEERPGMYSPYRCDIEIKRKGERVKVTGALHYHCRQCGGRFLGQRYNAKFQPLDVTNLVPFDIHEDGPVHKKAKKEQEEVGQVEPPKLCEGADLWDEDLSDLVLASMKDDFRLFVRWGCPAKLGQLADLGRTVIVEENGHVLVQHLACSDARDKCEPGKRHCACCYRLAGSRSLAKEAASSIYKIYLTDMLMLSMADKHEEQGKLQHKMLGSAWSSHTSYDIAGLAELTFNQLVDRCTVVILQWPELTMNPALN